MYSTGCSSENLMKLEFSDRFSKNALIGNFIKICPVGTELFYADRRTDGQA